MTSPHSRDPDKSAIICSTAWHFEQDGIVTVAVKKLAETDDCRTSNFAAVPRLEMGVRY
jgi:hypothetical protein